MWHGGLDLCTFMMMGCLFFSYLILCLVMGVSFEFFSLLFFSSSNSFNPINLNYFITMFYPCQISKVFLEFFAKCFDQELSFLSNRFGSALYFGQVCNVLIFY